MTRSGLVPGTVIQLRFVSVMMLATLASGSASSAYVGQRVDYATSADVSGDKSRVVGYAGMLFE